MKKIFRGRSDMNTAAVVILLCAMCFTRGIYAALGSARNEEAIFDTLTRLIDAEIYQLTDLVYKHVEFQKPNSAGLERVFRNRFDLFLGVPREILTSGLDLKDRADFGILNKFFGERDSSAANKSAGGPPPPGGNRTHDEMVTAPGDNATRVKYNNTVPTINAIIKSDGFTTTTTGRMSSNGNNITVLVSSKVDGCPEYTTVDGVHDGATAATITSVSNPRGPRTTPDTTSSERRPATTSLSPGVPRPANKTVIVDNVTGNVCGNNNTERGEHHTDDRGEIVPTTVRRLAAAITNPIGRSSSALSNGISYDYSNYGR